MPNRTTSRSDPDRRELLSYSAFFGSAFMARRGLGALPAGAAQAPAASPPVRGMKKSINLWAFPYPDKWSLKECFQIAREAGFDAVEPNFDLEGEFSAESSDDEIRAVKRMADEAGIAISGVCSFLFWPYSMTHPDPERRAKGIELALPSSYKSVRQRPEGSGRLTTLGTAEFAGVRKATGQQHAGCARQC